MLVSTPFEKIKGMSFLKRVKRFAIDLNEVVGFKDSKLVMGGKGFYEQCLEVTLGKKSYTFKERYCTLRAKARNSDGNLVESTLVLDLNELIYPSATVINLQKLFAYFFSSL